MKARHLIIFLVAMTLSAQAETLTPTKESKQEDMLLTQVGKQVELHLKSGEKFSGKVAFVGDKLVHLTTLTGMEMFEATVSISDVSAIVVRTAK